MPAALCRTWTYYSHTTTLCIFIIVPEDADIATPNCHRDYPVKQ
jgi:hypothetical protein